ncbi:hypothetical protein LJX78_04060 [Methanimicrococcus blatticola]|uniref:hypothetical protein n=1 Tax=Methanimicrococcus blatticola TaxID=91560 RepID=UPI001E2A681F|nr:hypothetical protein [Methanimicrococcus blatticola]MCC2508787.1 hypothetical protein [Methanimicrococcus blatticola]
MLHVSALLCASAHFYRIRSLTRTCRRYLAIAVLLLPCRCRAVATLPLPCCCYLAVAVPLLPYRFRFLPCRARCLLLL